MMPMLVSDGNDNNFISTTSSADDDDDVSVEVGSRRHGNDNNKADAWASALKERLGQCVLSFNVKLKEASTTRGYGNQCVLSFTWGTHWPTLRPARSPSECFLSK